MGVLNVGRRDGVAVSDHNHYGFAMHVQDLHASILYLMGFDHERMARVRSRSNVDANAARSFGL